MRDAAALWDFRSDTVTRPTAEMLQAMVEAPMGDAVFFEDPTVNALEAEIAAMLGKEAALYVPSGTMSNQLALRVHLGSLDEVLCDERAHIHVWEVGGIHAHTGASVAAIAPEPGRRFLCADAVVANASLDNACYHRPTTRLLALENTLNGTVAPASLVTEAARAARGLGLATHLDGARLWNACAATGHEPIEYTPEFDSVSVCLSKGLGAPVGSVLAADADHIDCARHFRKQFGGGWRQAGLLAAAGLHAVREHRSRLVEDHETACELAHGLTLLGFDVEPPETNMVWCDPPCELPMPFSELAERLSAEDGILVGGAYTGPRGRNPFGSQAKSTRFVTHMQTPPTAVRALLSGISRLLRRGAA